MALLGLKAGAFLLQGFQARFHHVVGQVEPGGPAEQRGHLGADRLEAGGVVRVRMESGRTYPWRTIRPGQPTTFRGVPCWWRASWQSESGKTYTIPTPGLVCPWGQP